VARGSAASAKKGKLQVTVDPVTERLIGELAAVGMFGTTHSEVSCYILRNWLWDNQEKLRQNGVFPVPPESNTPKTKR
jgi:hypothetical protein